MAILKNRLANNFAVIPNYLMTDKRLSLGARVVMAHVMGLPDEWNIFNADICKKIGVSEDTLTRYWHELEQNGWILRYRRRDERGKMEGGMVYEVLDGTLESTAKQGAKPYPVKCRKREKTGNGKNTEHTKKQLETKKQGKQNNTHAKGGEVVVASTLFADDEIQREIAQYVQSDVLREVVLAEYKKAAGKGKISNPRAYLRKLCELANQGKLNVTSNPAQGKRSQIEAANQHAAAEWVAKKMAEIGQ